MVLCDCRCSYLNIMTLIPPIMIILIIISSTSLGAWLLTFKCSFKDIIGSSHDNISERSAVHSGIHKATIGTSTEFVWRIRKAISHPHCIISWGNAVTKNRSAVKLSKKSLWFHISSFLKSEMEILIQRSLRKENSLGIPQHCPSSGRLSLQRNLALHSAECSRSESGFRNNT